MEKTNKSGGINKHEQTVTLAMSKPQKRALYIEFNQLEASPVPAYMLLKQDKIRALQCFFTD